MVLGHQHLCFDSLKLKDIFVKLAMLGDFRLTEFKRINISDQILPLRFKNLYESEAVGLFAKQYECLLTQFRSSNKSQKE